MNLLLALLGGANDQGVSVSKGTLEVVALILLIVLLAVILFSKVRHR